MKRAQTILFRLFLPFILLLAACSSSPKEFSPSKEQLSIYPDYTSIAIPPNIAPMNFRINNEGEAFMIKIVNTEGNSIKLNTNTGKVLIPESKWKKLLEEDKGGTLTYEVYRKLADHSWEKFEDISNSIASDEIDRYVAFRKITSVHTLWKKMGIYQRSLEDFRVTPIMTNDLTDGNCMNCHTFNKGNPEEMLIHMRKAYGGTLIKTKEDLDFINTSSDHTRGAGAYASWHPNGNIIAFSVNDVKQSFLSKIGKNLIVYDKHSDIILYDLDKNTVTRPDLLSTKALENLPTWSPDGKILYFISAKEIDYSADYTDTKYDLLSIGFDEVSRKFEEPDTLIKSADLGKSITFPRASPSGKYISFIGVDYGYFSINNREADVYMYNTSSKQIIKPDLNSSMTESYPSWSSNGSWLMFVSKREDGDLSQLWFCHIDEKGNSTKPFVLPQKDPDFYDEYIFNYNRPEFITGKVSIHPRKIFSFVKSGPKQTFFNDGESVSLTTGATVLSPEQEREGIPYHQ